jgi:hypothetical protein
MLEPAEYPQLIITHMDDSETVIHLTNADAYSWHTTTDGLTVRRVTGRTTFPWPTVKCYTIIPIAGKYRPSDLPDFDNTVMRSTECAIDYSRIVDELRQTIRDATDSPKRRKPHKRRTRIGNEIHIDEAYPPNTMRCVHGVEPGFYCTMCHDKTQTIARAYGAPRAMNRCIHGWLTTICPTCVTVE